MLRLYNSLTKTIEDFKPMHPNKVGMYTCGPTVYQFAHIGNFRAYSTSDLLVRVLRFNGYSVNFVMNITDVGHLTSDADTGEDKLEKSAKKEGKTAWEVAEFYTNIFLNDYKKLHLTLPTHLVKATEHIKEQIALIERLEKKGFTYQTNDGVYFDTSKFPNYGELSTLDEIKEGARVEINPEKRNPRDFAVWKFSNPKDTEEIHVKRQMEWESPWGIGFPGWHIECSAMSMKYLGPHFDIHTGGVDHLSIHHPDEIAQSEAATGQKFVNYWLHTAFMLVQGQKMSKSLGNIYRLYDLEKEGFDPLALRYLYLQTHYRQEMNFTFHSLEAAQNALTHLRNSLRTANIKEVIGKKESQKKESEELSRDFIKQFTQAVNDDLNLPQALGVVWDMLKSDENEDIKLASILQMDQVLGLDLQHWLEAQKKLSHSQIPMEVKELVEVRNQLRREKRFAQADQVRERIKNLGYDVEDGKKDVVIRKIIETT